MNFESSIPELKTQLNQFSTLFADIQFKTLAHILMYFLIGLIITLCARWFFGKMTEKNVSRHHSMLLRRIILYIGLALSIIFPLKASGIDVTALLGAAGILTAAVAFAAQTSISNFLSGIFLVAEKPFVIGDFVSISDLVGEILSIDMLSVKIRTRDNLFVRIPNETLLKSQFCNLSRFPIRRFDLKLRVSFSEDLSKVKEILMKIAQENPNCLVSPKPELFFNEFGENGVLLQFSTWSKQAGYAQYQTLLQTEVQMALAANKIELPVAQVTSTKQP